MANYNLDNEDLDTLDVFTQQAIKDARGDASVTDETLAHYYALRGKLGKIREGRERTDSEPKPRKARKRATVKPTTGSITSEPLA